MSHEPCLVHASCIPHTPSNTHTPLPHLSRYTPLSPLPHPSQALDLAANDEVDISFVRIKLAQLVVLQPLSTDWDALMESGKVM